MVLRENFVRMFVILTHFWLLLEIQLSCLLVLLLVCFIRKCSLGFVFGKYYISFHLQWHFMFSLIQILLVLEVYLPGLSFLTDNAMKYYLFSYIIKLLNCRRDVW